MNPRIDTEFKNFAARKLNKINFKSIQAVLDLTAEGGTVPFIARYRKEKTGNLDEVQIREVLETFESWKEITERKEFILKEFEKIENLPTGLKAQVAASFDLGEIEELYRPYKKKKESKARLAVKAGLQPFADWIWQLGQGEIQDNTLLEVKAKEFINPAAGYAMYEEVLRGAQHILVEKLSNIPELRQRVRDEYIKNGVLVSQKTTQYKTNSKYSMYAEYREKVTSLQSKKSSHRYLALRRGWQEEELKVTIEADSAGLQKLFENYALKNPSSMVAGFLKTCAETALKVHVEPSITNEIHRALKEQADLDAIHVFAENLRRVLMASPFGARTVLGIDPGLKTGCKIALIDRTGRFISHTVMHILSEDDFTKAKTLFGEVFKQIKIDVVAIGNGTAGRETETFVRKILKEINVERPVVMVNESGASVYSASEVAREEFPDLDLTVRGAISIARRLQDPLAELVKIEPKSIGVGQYQHDVSEGRLKKSLHDVVESCVNQVGVDLNTASTSLLQYVAGIGPTIAKNIIEYRTSKGLFEDRSDLLKVPAFGSKVFEQAGGFLRLQDGKSPLDRTGIHPERYSAVREMAQDLGLTVSKLMTTDGANALKAKRDKWAPLVGEFTFDDIVRELEKPGRDPRDPYKIFQYREDIHEIKDLKEGMLCPGIVTNVTNFGAFVDIGVHQDGLVHISELSNEFVSDPRQVVSPGDQVQVKVIGFDVEKSQISLSMILGEKKPVMRARPPREQSDQPRQPRPQRPPRRDGEQKQAGEQRPRPPRREGDRPRGPRPDGAQAQGQGQRRDQRNDRGPRRDDRGPRQGGDRPQGQRKPATPFNNPFASLLKK